MIQWKLTRFRGIRLKTIVRPVELGQGREGVTATPIAIPHREGVTTGRRHHSGRPQEQERPQMNGDGPRRVHLRKVLSLPERGCALGWLLPAPRSRTGRQHPIGPNHRVSLQQPTMARLASLAIRLQSVSSLPKQSPDTLGSSQFATMGPGPPLTTPLPLVGSQTRAIQCSPLPGEARHQTPGLAPLTSPDRTRNRIGALPSRGPPSIAIVGLEPPGNSTSQRLPSAPRRSQSGS